MKSKRFIALFLCIMMLCSLLPAAAFADEPAEDEEIIYADDEVIAEEAPAEEIPADEASDEERIPAEAPAEEEIPEAAEELPNETVEEEPEEEIIPDESEDEIASDELIADDEIPAEPETEDEDNEFEASGTCGTNLNWSFSNGTLTISGSGAMTDYEIEVSPAPPWHSFSDDITKVVFSGSVSSIGNGAFNAANNLTTVDFGSSASTIRSIGHYAFSYCYSLTGITIPSGVTSIGEEAFRKCSSLKSITIPGSVTSISSYTFEDCSSLTSVTISSGVKSIGFGAFRFCEKLTDLTIPNSVTSIGEDAFCCCYSLTSVTIPGSVTSLDSSAFRVCTALTHINVASGNSKYTSVNGVLFSSDRKTLVTYPAGKTETEYTVPSDVTLIQPYAFSGARLTSITIPNGVTSIGKGTFSGSKLTGITIPNGVTSIGDQAFANCYNLASITIPNSVTSIGEYAFTYCSALTGITIPNRVTKLSKGVFLGCTALTEITIPDSVTVIDSYAFTDGRFTSITIPAGVTSINAYAFSYCRLNTIYFKGKAPAIGEDAFKNVTATAYYSTGDSSWTSSVKQNYGGTITWKVNAIDSGKCGTGLTWTFDADGILTISGISYMDNYASTETSTTAPWAAYSDRITKIVFEGEANNVGEYAFAGLTKLKSVDFGSSTATIRTIGRQAFYGCTALTEITLPTYLEEIGRMAFRGCSALSQINPLTTWNASSYPALKTIGIGAFTATAVSALYIPRTVQSISDNFVNNCKNLKTLVVISGNQWYKSENNVLFNADGTLLYAYPAGLTAAEYTVPSGTTEILPRAFVGNGNLTAVTIPATVSKLDSAVFYGNSKLKTITFKGNAPAFDSTAFSGVEATAYYPAGNNTWTSSVMQNYGGIITWKTLVKTAPVISSIDNHADYMIIRWGKVEGATSYKLAYRAGSGAWQTMDVSLSSVDGKGNPRVNLKGLTVGTTYTFIAYANFSDGSSTKSASAAQVRLLSPAVKVSKFGTNASNGGFQLSWNATAGGSCYKIYYREKGGSWALYTMIPKSANTLFCNIKGSVTNANANLPNLVAGKTYEFAVLTATSQTNITSGFPTSYTGYKF